MSDFQVQHESQSWQRLHFGGAEGVLLAPVAWRPKTYLEITSTVSLEAHRGILGKCKNIIVLMFAIRSTRRTIHLHEKKLLAVQSRSSHSSNHGNLWCDGRTFMHHVLSVIRVLCSTTGKFDFFIVW